MKIEISNFKYSIQNIGKTVSEMVCKKFKIESKNIKELIIKKESIDARNKQNILIVYNLILDVTDDIAGKMIKFGAKEYVDKTAQIEEYKWNATDRPVVVGFGPAGIFAALYLSRMGAKPIIIERGGDMESRINDVNEFINNKVINENSNIQFGEGGAGTFSDGKLQTNDNDPLINSILIEFNKYGAPNDILYSSHPHIGTDYLRKVIVNMREDMKLLGAEFYFYNTLSDIEIKDDYVICKTNKNHQFETKHLILGLGHSARDTFKMLYDKRIQMEPKSFSMGVRIEHRREDINKIQYGAFWKMLSPSSYKLAVHLETRSVYSFCMCPGGEVMASASEKNSIVTNGMSLYARDKDNSNAALLVNVTPEDFYKSSPLDGLKYQEEYEKKAFDLSGDYKAPANLVKEFLNGQIASSPRSVIPSYPHGVKFGDFYKVLPKYVVDSLKEALPLFDRKMKGFASDDAILTGVETRSSCPLRINRNDLKQSSCQYIYPIGEGAGYAGGITTAALDGLKTAIAICKESK